MCMYEKRALNLAYYIIQTKSTVRKTAMVFNISKSTVHNDITKKLPKISRELYTQVDKIMKENFRIKHIRGGEATRQKYKNCHNTKSKV